MLEYLATTRYPARDRVMFLLSMKAGLRAKEMASLTWAMVTDAQGQVAEVMHVPNRASKGTTGGRTIPLHPDLQAALVIKACVTGGTLIALTGQFRVIKATLDDLFGLTRGTRDAVWPAQLADGLITLHIIDQILDIDLHRWTPVRVREMGYPQYTPSSNSTTLESNMSLDPNYAQKMQRA